MPNPAQPSLERFVTAVFQSWREGAVEFLVLRNYEGLPRETTNDIDVLVRPNQRREAEQLLVAAAATAGFRLHNRAEFATLALYFSTPGGELQAHFDLFVDLQWRGLDYLNARGFLDRRVNSGLIDVPDPVDEATTNLLSFLIYTGKVKEKYRLGIRQVFGNHPETAVKRLEGIYGGALAARVVRAVGAENWPEVETLTAALRKALLTTQLLLRPARGVASLGRSLGRWIRRFLFPPGITVVLCGPDGCGKSTAMERVVELLAPSFSPAKGRQFHWKPPVFSGRRQAARPAVTDPHAAPCRSVPASILAFSVHWLEFWLGMWLVLRPVLFKGGLVLIDRWYYDFFIDQRRYRLHVPQGLVRAGYRLLTKPCLLILLDAPAALLRKRKQELSLEELERQRSAYAAVLKPLLNCVVIDATKGSDQVAAEIRKAVLDATARKARLG